MTEVALAIVHDSRSDKVLVIRRARKISYSGWAFPGGKIEQCENGISESPVAAARRELAEETGLRLRSRGLEIYCRQHPKTGFIMRYVYFECSRNVNVKNAEPDKSDDCVWVEISRLGALFDNSLCAGLAQRIQTQPLEKRRLAKQARVLEKLDYGMFA